jgi:threonine/homoserine/homoserine lactone efflux protein
VHFRRGLVVALSNPKTIAFFTAFLPQSSMRIFRQVISLR